MGESVVEATVGRWLKQEGERVNAGEPLVELETDKVNLEVGAQNAGVLARIEVKEGQDVKVGDILAVIEESAEAAQPAPPTPEATLAKPHEAAPARQEPLRVAEDGGKAATPVARRMAQEFGIPLTAVSGSGPGGQVTKEDVQRYMEQQRAAPAADSTTIPPARTVQPPEPIPAPAAPERPPAPVEQRAPAPLSSAPPAVADADRREERVRMSRRRQTIARRLVEVQHTAAMLTTFNEVDMSAVQELRRRRKESFKERHGIGLGLMSFFVKAAIGALKAFPRLNAEIQGDDMLLKYFYDIGIAVGAEEGLVVPVIRDADSLTFAEIERKIEAYVQQAQDGTLAIEDLRGGTFTISNGGVFGSLMSTPILNPPQVGILGLHKIEERPVVANGEIVVRPMMYVALSYDHRIVDGREAVQFLVRVKQLVEDPETLLLEG
jgi:2-oxoglutarate dehydrogenase E2 component (dihydrolipoamide succinyltransferase)